MGDATVQVGWRPRSPGLVLTLLALTLFAGAPSGAQEAKPGEETRVKFKARHALSSWAAQKERIAYSKQRLARMGDEPKADESTFRVMLPRGYRAKGRNPYGLLIWISPDPDGRIPKSWRGELRRKRLILVGPDAAGNDQPLPRRIALALDALAGAKDRYRVDPARIYAIGFSGGANVATWLSLHYSDLFKGVALMSGCDTYRPVPVPGRKGSFWRGSIPEPKAELLKLAKKGVQVFFSGDSDPAARRQAEAVAALHRKLGFRRVSLRIAPELGHEPPPPVELRRILALLDAAETPASKPTSRPSR
jgi:predicted esterase